MVFPAIIFSVYDASGMPAELNGNRGVALSEVSMPRKQKQRSISGLFENQAARKKI